MPSPPPPGKASPGAKASPAHKAGNSTEAPPPTLHLGNFTPTVNHTKPPIPPVPYVQFYLPIYVVTAVFLFVFIFGPLFVKKGPNRGIVRTCIFLTSFSMWLLWVTVYIAQMNPLVGPRLTNSSMAWLAHHWGLPFEATRDLPLFSGEEVAQPRFGGDNLPPDSAGNIGPGADDIVYRRSYEDTIHDEADNWNFTTMSSVLALMNQED